MVAKLFTDTQTQTYSGVGNCRVVKLRCFSEYIYQSQYNLSAIAFDVLPCE